ncbi:MAG: hypothetical protein HRT44_02095 [Bdellovibrionales bacterium]|nr:hypothetical protein [Bdellovibrionales bacterium]NQZ18038.1 hypothetical protein [Bdellovibrionales bacterium]
MKKIKSTYNKYKIQRVKDYLGIDVKSYHPLLGNSESLKKLTNEDVDIIQELNFSNIADPKSYNIRVEMDEKLGITKHFYFDRENYHLEKNWDLKTSVNEIYQALKLLERNNDWMNTLFHELVDDVWVVWNGKDDRFHGGAGTDYYYLGLMMMSLRHNDEFKIFEQVFALAHELGHTVLYYLQAGSNPISEESFGQWIYSGIRKTSRPSYASLHAAMALGYMVVAVRSLLEDKNLTQKEIDFLKGNEQEFTSNLKSGLEVLPEIKLTKLGEVLVSELQSLV